MKAVIVRPKASLDLESKVDFPDRVKQAAVGVMDLHLLRLSSSGVSI
jgi:hypothetical protein